jgi:hypothetical protein
MNTLSLSEIAKKHLSNLGINDLTNYTVEERNKFWCTVNAEYIAQFDNLQS